MRKTTFLFLAITGLLSFASCNKSDDTSSNSTSQLAATWNIQTFDGAPSTGTLVFTSGTLNFVSGANTENDTYVQSGTKLTFTKTGGSVNWISGGSDWTVDILTANALQITSKFGLIITATK